jgi:hypothetical protein
MQTTYIELKSSLLKSCIYNAEAEEFTVVFHNEAMYTYSKVSLDEYADFLKAESQGSYFTKNIKGKKEFLKIGEHNHDTSNNQQDEPREVLRKKQVPTDGSEEI